MRVAALAVALLLAGPAAAQTMNDRLSGDIAPVHDPVLIRHGGTYHVFSTGLPGDAGRLLQWRTSADMLGWKVAPPPVTEIPAWAAELVPGATNLWAPDIALVGGRYRLYYSVSTFGSNRSAIGLFSSPTLDRDAPGYGWRDDGLVVQSKPGDDFNAIDPNFIVDREGRHWLSLGSFWGGIKLFELDPETGRPLHADAPPHTLARRLAPAGAPAPVEAPFIIDHGGWYWLFASYDYCCKGVFSTYYTVVGRAKEITGPYLGKDGSSMLNGQGTVFLRADLPEKERFRGPGHVGILRDGGRDYVVYHAYDRQNRGAPTLRIAPIRWGADGWPTAED